jgi:hypothetical protein
MFVTSDILLFKDVILVSCGSREALRASPTALQTVLGALQTFVGVAPNSPLPEALFRSTRPAGKVPAAEALIYSHKHILTVAMLNRRSKKYIENR